MALQRFYFYTMNEQVQQVYDRLREELKAARSQDADLFRQLGSCIVACRQSQRKRGMSM